MKYLALFLLLAVIVYLPGCEDLPCNKVIDQSVLDTVNQVQFQTDIALIDDYLNTNGITAQQDPSGIRYVVEKEGFGGTPCFENQVSVIYTGRLLSNGTEFDSGAIEGQLKVFILGWNIMLPKFAKGAKFTIYIPSGYAYGASGSGTTIPANAILIFDIELVNIR